MHDGNAALFIGAGMSRKVGFVDWKGLLRPYAEELGLEIEQETDLVALAQYYLNSMNGERSFLNQALIDEFDKPGLFTPSHRIIARLPIPIIWTTNYDMLIEEAYRKENKNLDVKIRDRDIGIRRKACKALLYKMHGDIARPDEIIISKEDYERYPRTHPVFQSMLTTDLLNKTFLFLGFSFDDSNFTYTLGHLRSQLENSKRAHYAITRRTRRDRHWGESKNELEPATKFEYRKDRQAIQLDDLQRYSINTHLVDDFDHVEEILEAIEVRYLQKNIFVSGSLESEQFDRYRLRNLWKELAGRLIDEGYNLVCGFESDAASPVAEGALVKLNKFPDEQRESMIARSGFAIFLGGSERQCERVRLDFEIARKLKKILVPIGATGFAAREIWERVDAEWETCYPDTFKVGKREKLVEGKFEKLFERKLFEALNDSKMPNEKLLDVVVKIIKGAPDKNPVLPSEEKALRYFLELNQRYPNLPEALLKETVERVTRVIIDNIDLS